MKLFYKNFLFLLMLMACSQVCSCNPSSAVTEIPKSSSASVKIANWNLQTFFDAVPTGNEYFGFTKNDKGWNQERYLDRVERLCSVIQSIDADIIALEEIENEGVIYDIVNNYLFQGRRDKAYNYAIFAGESDQAFGVALLSRYPILDYSVHQISVVGEVSEQPKMRPIAKALVQVGDKTLSVYVCHWKSKSSGEEESEIWRNYSEVQLAKLISNDSNPVFVTGDFNRDLDEFQISSHLLSSDYTGSIKLRSSMSSDQLSAHSDQLSGRSDLPDVYLNSAWLFRAVASIYKDEGSYFYQDNWEKIDHFMFSKDVVLKSFSTVKYAENVSESGTPYRYSFWSGKGFSDHLPLECIIEL
ncbi:MAG: endonuclease/exonuclease/phosphatase family protein [Treponemataceae bacterium]|nr:endonuclease/exonuclease/phosphatase family protein [Treponemataceae bacterium]